MLSISHAVTTSLALQMSASWSMARGKIKVPSVRDPSAVASSLIHSDDDCRADDEEADRSNDDVLERQGRGEYDVGMECICVPDTSCRRLRGRVGHGSALAPIFTVSKPEARPRRLAVSEAKLACCLFWTHHQAHPRLDSMHC